MPPINPRLGAMTNPRLSSLGQVKSSPSNTRLRGAVGQERAASDVASLADFLNERRATLEELSSKEARSPLSRLASPTGAGIGIAALLAAALGGEDEAGQILLGGMEGAALGAQREQQQIDKEAQDLREQIQRGQTSLTTLFQARPGSFLTAEGKDIVDPVVLGRAMTGMPIAISAASLEAQQSRTLAQRTSAEFYMEQAINAPTPAARRQGLMGLNISQGLQMTDSAIDAFADAEDDTARWRVLSQHTDPVSFLDAYKVSLSGKPLSDPAVYSLLRPRLATGDGKYTMNDMRLEAHMQWAAALQNDPSLRDLPPEEQLQVIFADEPGKANTLIDDFQTNWEDTTLSAADIQSFYQQYFAGLSYIYAMDPNKAQEIFGTYDEMAGRAHEVVRGMMEAIDLQNLDAAADREGNTFEDARSRIERMYPGIDASASYFISRKVYSDALGAVQQRDPAPGMQVDRPSRPGFDWDLFTQELDSIIRSLPEEWEELTSGNGE